MLAAARFCRLSLLLAAALAAAASVAVAAEGKLDASYTVTLAGIPIGKGTWSISVSDTRYKATASGATTGLMHVLTGGHGSTEASGTFADGELTASTYASTIFAHKKTDSVRLTVSGGDIKDFDVDPPDEPNPQRVEITDTHRHGVIDPMSAAIMRTAGTGEAVSPEACNRKLPIFDGRMRYDLQLAYKRMEKVKAAEGYAGPAVVCAVYFTPIAGYVPTRVAIRYISRMRDMEVWLAPIVGTRVLVPFRAQGPTPIGAVVFAADKFISAAVPAASTVNGSKSQ